MKCNKCGTKIFTDSQTGVFWVELAVAAATAFREKRPLRVEEIRNALGKAFEY